MDRETGTAERRTRRSWWRLPLALILAPLALTIVLSAAVLLLTGLPDGTPAAAIERAARAAVVFASALFAFSLTFGAAGAVALLIARQRGIVIWAWTGALLGIVAAMLHGLATVGFVVGSEMTAGGLLGAILLLLIRRFAGVCEV